MPMRVKRIGNGCFGMDHSCALGMIKLKDDADHDFRDITLHTRDGQFCSTGVFVSYSPLWKETIKLL